MSDPFYTQEAPAAHISTTDIMTRIRESTNRFLDALADGERIKMTELCDKVAADTNIRNSSISAFVPAFAHSYPNSYVKNGRGGGVIKGVPTVRVDTRPRCPTCHQIDRNAHAREANATATTTSLEEASHIDGEDNDNLPMVHITSISNDRPISISEEEGIDNRSELIELSTQLETESNTQIETSVSAPEKDTTNE
jgi:hypothetical protein